MQHKTPQKLVDTIKVEDGKVFVTCEKATRIVFYSNAIFALGRSQPLQLTTPIYAAAVYHDKDVNVEIQEEVNMAIASWIKENGYDFAGPMFNIYYASPATTQNEDEFVTEVCYPVK